MMAGLRRHRSSVLVLAALVLAVVVTAVVGSREEEHAGDLDPANPAPAGARAVARVLQDQGVHVEVARDADAFDDIDVGAGTTVVVTSTEQLGRSTADRLAEHVSGARVVLVDPDPGILDALDADVPQRSAAVDQELPAGCDDPTYAGLTLAVDVAAQYDVPDGCFRGDSGAALVETDDGVVVLGAGAALSNDQVLRADNAAVALRLLGGTDRLVWYVPTYADLGASDGVSAASLLPRWLRPSLALLTVAVLALMLWRGRRLGPLVTEPLPVTVKAIETTRSRGRLYRRSGDRIHAADVLRSAARRRLAERLRLGRRPDPGTLVRDLAARAGRPVEDVEALIGPAAPPPATDRDLITLAHQLAELDREVRRP